MCTYRTRLGVDLGDAAKDAYIRSMLGHLHILANTKTNMYRKVFTNQTPGMVGNGSI